MTQTNTKPNRRWFRFSLRTLLIVFVLLSLPLGLLAWKMRQAERQRQAVEAIRAAGGSVMYDYEYDRSGVAIWQPESPVQTWLRKLVGIDLYDDVVWVGLGGSEASDVTLEHFKDMTSIECLFLSGTEVTDAGLEHLKGMTSLESLYLSGTQVTDAGLEQFKGMTNLGLLELCDTQVTDAGLEHLKGLTNLEALNLRGTQVTEDGIDELKKALPNCYTGWRPPT